MPLLRVPGDAARRARRSRLQAALPRRGGLLVLAVALVVLPALASNYVMFQLTNVGVLAIALLGLNLLAGYSGQMSLGHGAFFALGAYLTALLISRGGVGYGIAPLIAGAVCWPVGYLFGIPALRLRGHYLALATFALATALPQLLKHERLEPYTGGVLGIVLAKPGVPWGLPIGIDPWLYYIVLAFLAVATWLFWNLVRGRVGRALMAIRDNPIAAEAMGIDAARYKTVAFAYSAGFTGVAGGLSAIVVQFVSPEGFSTFLSLALLVGVVVGGLGSVSGALFGALFIQFVPDLLSDVSKSAAWAVYGVVLIGCIYLMPHGAAGLLAALARRFSPSARAPGAPVNRNEGGFNA